MNETVITTQVVNRTTVTGSALITNFIKVTVFFVVSLGLVVGTFFLENSFSGNKSKISTPTFNAFDYQKDNIIPDNGILRFAKAAQSGQPAIDIQSVKNKRYIFKLNSGKLWGNFEISTAKVNILIGKVVLIPDQAVFDLSFDGSKIVLNVYDGDVYTGFLPDNVTVSDYVDPYSNLFMNRLLVPRENQITIPLKKITEEIRPLLYSKLVKEFKYGAVPSELKDSQWVKDNLETDSKFIDALKQQFAADVLYGGTKVQDGFMNNFIFWAEENLTFIPDKNRKMTLTHLFDYLDDAIFYASQGQAADAEKSWQAFFTQIVQGQEFYDKFDDYIERLRIFAPDENGYKILKLLLNEKFTENRDRYQIVAMFWQDVYRALNRSDALTEEALNNYYEYFDKTRLTAASSASDSGDVDDDFYKMYLTYQNQLFDNLLMKYALFYKDGYFAIKDVLENDLLVLYEKGQLRDELKQALVSNKINFLKRLKRFFFDGQMEVKETKQIFKRLFGEIDELMPGDDSGLAVVKLFESQLDDMDDFWGYLNSPQYHSKTYGTTHEDRYKIYLQERETIWNFINIKEEVLGEPAEAKEDVTIVDVVDEVTKVLKANGDVTTVEIGKFDKVDQRYIPIKIVLGGYPLEANYDRDNGTLKDVKVYDEVISDRAVKLDSLLNILQQKFADLADKNPAKVGEAETIETTAQRFARTYISKKVSEFGFNVVIDNVEIADQLNAVYRVKDAIFKDYKDMKMTFDVLMSGEIATNVFVSVKGEPRVLDGKYSFEELATMVQAEYDFNGKVEKEPVKEIENPGITPIPR